MTEYLLISTAAGGTAFLLAYLLRSKWDVRDARPGEGEAGDADDFWGGQEHASSAALSAIFSREDEDFILAEGSPQVRSLFRRERRRQALRWIERQKFAGAAIMRSHRESSRSAADLVPSVEIALFARYTGLRLIFELLSASVWLAGPQRLRGLAERANAVFNGMQSAKSVGGEKKGFSA